MRLNAVVKTVVPALLVLALAGCGEATGPEASQIGVVIVDSVAYAATGRLDVAERPIGAAYAEVRRYVDCSQGVWLDDDTHVEDACFLEDGDSNFLPAGTVLYRIEGVDPSEALAVYREYDVVPPIEPEWLELAPLTGGEGDGCEPPAGGNLCAPPGWD